MALNIAQHIKFWQRCFNNFLPTAYTANDSTRLTFGFFIVSALELLSVPLTPSDRARVRAWALSLQHPDGGFCGSPTHVLSGQEAVKGSANLAATFFALLLLGGVAESGDDGAKAAAFAGVQRRKTLRWLRKLQRPDGSFGQVLWEGEAEGGRDMRHSYLASCVRWMLRGSLERGDDGWEEDIDVEGMMAHIRHTQTYDGGVAEASRHESHAGYAYCAVGALYMLDRPPGSDSPHRSSAAARGMPDRTRLIQFLANRQFNYLAEEEQMDLDQDNDNLIETALGQLTLDTCTHVGWNGRWNKKADTCYCWWVGGTLSMMDASHAVNRAPSRRYLLDITQPWTGGFSKFAEGHADIYHSYLGLAALATMGEEADLKQFDVGLCCSTATVRSIILARDGLLGAETARARDSAGDGFWDDSKPSA